MIKFVCASCGERLSVPDQHGGRKGRCPICQGVNRIPLKGFAETQPSSPTVARNAPSSAQTPAAPEMAPHSMTEIPTIESAPSKVAAESTVAQAPVPSAPPPISAAPASPAPVSTERFTSATKFIAPPDDAANLRAIRRSKQQAAKTIPYSESPQSSVNEWHLPRKLKMTLLMLTALAIASSLYFALRWALNMAINELPPVK